MLNQPLLIVLYFLLSIYFIYFNKRKSIPLIWFGLIVSIDIFNSQKYLNLTAIKVLGLCYIPILTMNLKSILREKIGKAYFGQILFLFLLGLYFGVINPWDNPGNIRVGRDAPSLRFLIHTGSIFLELLACFYISSILKKTKDGIKTICISFIAGSMASSVFAGIEYMTHFDFYHFFTAQPEIYIADRMKGLNYEPRGLSQSCAYSILLSIIFYKTLKKWIFIILPILLFGGYLMTYSTAGNMTLVIGGGVLYSVYVFQLFKLENKRKLLVNLFGVFAIIISLAAYNYASDNTLFKRLVHKKNIYEDTRFINKLEIFDSSTANFFYENPKFLFFGVGPGLAYFPASQAMTPEKKKNWPHGFTALPHMGVILLVANGGVLNLLIWLFIAYCFLKESHSGSGENSEAFKLILVFLVLYLFQIRYAVFISTALGLRFSMSFKNFKSLYFSKESVEQVKLV